MGGSPNPNVIVVYALLYAAVCVPALIYLWKKGVGNEALFWVFVAVTFPFFAAVRNAEGVKPIADEFFSSSVELWFMMAGAFLLWFRSWSIIIGDNLGFVPWRALAVFASGYAVMFVGSGYILEVRAELRPVVEYLIWIAPFAALFGAILVGYREYQNWQNSED